MLYLSSLYEKDGITQDDLAQEYSVDKAAVTRTVQLMEKNAIDSFSKQIDDMVERAKELNPKEREIK